MKTMLVWPWPVFGPVEHEEVGEAVDGRALVRRHPAVGPRLGQRAARAADDALGDRLLGGPEAGGDDDHVDRALDAVAGDDRRSG